LFNKHALIIYGATGYTGGLLARAAKQRGLRPILAGRDESKLRALGGELGLEHRVAPLDARLAGALGGAGVLLNAAGPFSKTALPLVEACLRKRLHYLDLSGEVAVIEAVRALGARAADAKVMLMTGVGFDVVPSDCLAAHVASRLARGSGPSRASRLSIGVSGLQMVSRGSARTIVDQAGESVSVRRDGAIVGVPPGTLERTFDYGEGERASLAVSWGDVASAFYTTAIPNIEVYWEATAPVRAWSMSSRLFGGFLRNPLGRSWLGFHAEMLPDGPTDEERARGRAVIVAEADDGEGGKVRARLRTPEAYTLSCSTSLAIAERVAGGDFEIGFQTPARVYGADFVLAFPGVVREDLRA